jgi:hypothetical protein
MYLGAGLTLSGAAVLYESATLFRYALLFLLVVRLFVILYEEPTLRLSFATEYGSIADAPVAGGPNGEHRQILSDDTCGAASVGRSSTSLGFKW